MKLLVVGCLKEYCHAVGKIFEKAGIEVFSMADVTGKKDTHTVNLVDNWFSSGEEVYDSAFLFSFTKAENAEKAMVLIDDYNRSANTNFPLRAFILPVERSSY